MESGILRKSKDRGDINIHEVYERIASSNIDASPQKMLVVSNLIGEFAQLMATLRSNPEKFQNKLEKLRDKALKPYLKDPIKFHQDIVLINLTYSHIVGYVTNNINPILEESIQIARQRRTEDIEWAVKGTGGILRSTAVGTFRHGIPAGMIAYGTHNLMKASAILASVIHTIDSYAKDPFGRCSVMSRVDIENAAALKRYQDELESHWFASWRNLDIQKPTMVEREMGFFTKLTDTMLCTVPQWTTGIAGGVFSGSAEITGAITSTLAAFTILLLGVMLWLLLNKNSQFGIPFLIYFGFTDPDSKAQAATTHFIQQVAPAITSGALSPPKAIVREVSKIENSASDAYVRKIEDKRKSPSEIRVKAATEASINILKKEAKQASPVARVILESKANEQTKEIRGILKSTSPKHTVPSFLEEIKKGQGRLKSSKSRTLKSPPKSNQIFNDDLIRKIQQRRRAVEDDTEWTFGRLMRKRSMRKRSKVRMRKGSMRKRSMRKRSKVRVRKRSMRKRSKRSRRSNKKINNSL